MVGRLKLEVDMAPTERSEMRPFLASSGGESETEFTTDAEDAPLSNKASRANKSNSTLDLIGDQAMDLPDRPDGASYVEIYNIMISFLF